MRDFTRGQAVQLRLGHLGGWTARVEAVMPDRLAVATLAQLPVSGTDLAGTTVDIAAATVRGIAQVPGVVTAADRTGLLEIALTGDVSFDQRRNWVRVPASLPGLVVPQGVEDPHPPLHTFTLDVSAGGVLLAGAGPSGVGTPVQVTVKLPDRDPLQAEGRIARRTHVGQAGIVFEGIDERERELLIRWIFERQRRERQAARERL